MQFIILGTIAMWQLNLPSFSNNNTVESSYAYAIVNFKFRTQWHIFRTYTLSAFFCNRNAWILTTVLSSGHKTELVLPSISGVLLSFSGHHIQWTRGPGPIETQIGMHCRGGSRNFKRGWTYSDSGWQPAKLGVWGHAPWKDLHSELLHFMTFEVKHTQKIAPLSAVFSF